MLMLQFFYHSVGSGEHSSGLFLNTVIAIRMARSFCHRIISRNCFKRSRNSLEPKMAERVSERSMRCFASLVPNNINLIYLRRNLVVNLLSNQDTFEQKVVGCFVRLKVTPKMHIYRKSTNAFVLGQVTGIKQTSEEYKVNDRYTNILLCITSPWADVRISTLSDEDLQEDECRDLISSVKEGLLERATIWIERELVILQRNIDRAVISGLHVQMDELLHQMNLLSTPEERQRRLEEVPEIEYEETETELEHEASSVGSSWP